MLPVAGGGPVLPFVNVRLGRSARDQAGGALCSAHVPRHRPAADASSLTSLRRAPHRPDPDPQWRRGPRASPPMPHAKDVGWPSSEVKEEGRAQPGPGDMSGVGHPASLARADAGQE